MHTARLHAPALAALVCAASLSVSTSASAQGAGASFSSWDTSSSLAGATAIPASILGAALLGLDIGFLVAAVDNGRRGLTVGWAIAEMVHGALQLVGAGLALSLSPNLVTGSISSAVGGIGITLIAHAIWSLVTRASAPPEAQLDIQPLEQGALLSVRGRL